MKVKQQGYGLALMAELIGGALLGEVGSSYDSDHDMYDMYEWYCWLLMVMAYLIFVISFTQAGFSNSKFYTKKYLKFTPKRVKYVFVNLENVYTGSARGARDKYEVWT